MLTGERTYQSGKRKLANQQVCSFLILPDLTQGLRSGSPAAGASSRDRVASLSYIVSLVAG